MIDARLLDTESFWGSSSIRDRKSALNVASLPLHLTYTTISYVCFQNIEYVGFKMPNEMVRLHQIFS